MSLAELSIFAGLCLIPILIVVAVCGAIAEWWRELWQPR